MAVNFYQTNCWHAALKDITIEIKKFWPTFWWRVFAERMFCQIFKLWGIIRSFRERATVNNEQRYTVYCIYHVYCMTKNFITCDLLYIMSDSVIFKNTNRDLFNLIWSFILSLMYSKQRFTNIAILWRLHVLKYARTTVNVISRQMICRAIPWDTFSLVFELKGIDIFVPLETEERRETYW